MSAASQITDPKSNITTLTYTPVELIATIKDAQQHITTYGYDARGNRTSVIDPVTGSEHPTTFAYDLMNRLTGITYPDGSTVGFTYDKSGQIWGQGRDVPNFQLAGSQSFFHTLHVTSNLASPI